MRSSAWEETIMESLGEETTHSQALLVAFPREVNGLPMKRKGEVNLSLLSFWDSRVVPTQKQLLFAFFLEQEVGL